jgi:tRNA-dihydrouridine synthase
MAQITGLVRNNKPTLAKTIISDDTPVQIQLLGTREDQLEKYVKKFVPSPGFMGFNLNLSCPSTNVIAAGQGCALIKRTSKTSRLVSIIKKANYPVSIKLRLGTNEYERQKKVYLNCIKSIDADFFVVHAKTAAQTSFEAPSYKVYPECVEAANGKPIIANGEINTSEKVLMLKEMGVSGVMIGRSALKNPAIFDLLKNECGYNNPKKEIPSAQVLKKEYLELATKYHAPGKYKENVFKNWV